MKLRMRKDSVRLRLTQGEIAKLGASGAVEEAVHFGPGPSNVLRYRLMVSESDTSLCANLTGNTIEIRLPLQLSREWTGTDRVSLEGGQELGGGQRLKILLEKDFACLTERTGEDAPDAYPHPLARTC